MMEWPPQSPDMNLIESLWEIVDLKIQRNLLTSKSEMWSLIQKAWSEVTQSEIRKLFQSMPRRMEAVIEAKGGHTTY